MRVDSVRWLSKRYVGGEDGRQSHLLEGAYVKGELENNPPPQSGSHLLLKKRGLFSGYSTCKQT